MSNTCGEGLAHHAVLPARLSELLAAVAENLEAHLTTIDARDERSRPEHDAYIALASEHRALELRLRQLSARMAGYRALPMACHDSLALASPRVREAFERLVGAEAAVADLLATWIVEHRAMPGQ